MRGFSKDCRMPQFLHLHHQGRGHSPCHHQLQWSSEWTRQRTTIIVMIYLLFIFNIIVLDIWNLRKIEFLSTSYCIYLLLFWCMGQGWKFPKSQLYISNMWRCQEDQDTERQLYISNMWVVMKIKTITKKNPISTIPVEDHEIHNYSSEEANEDSDPEWFVACLVPATVMRFQFAVQSTNGQSEDPCTGWLEVLNGYNYQLSQ